MLLPKKTKFRNEFKGRIKGISSRGFSISFGDFAIKALEPERITNRQIESARRAMVRSMKREGKLWIRVFPNVPVSKKPAEVRMGGGKGGFDSWVVRVNPGRILFEISGVSEEIARQAYFLGVAKLPIKTVFLAKKDKIFL